MNSPEQFETRSSLRSVARTVRDSVGDLVAVLVELLRPLLRPAALFVVVPDPGGVGKSTPLGNLPEEASPSCRWQGLAPGSAGVFWPKKSNGAAIDQHAENDPGEQILLQALKQFTGNGRVHSFSKEDKTSPPDDAEVFSVGEASPRWMADFLGQLGYSRNHCFAVLPSRRSPRWLLPLGERRRSLQGFQIYNACTPTGQLLKSLLSRLIQTGWKGWARDRVVVAADKPLALETLIQEVTGEDRPFFALSLRSPASHWKLTLQVMRPSGEILGYIKIPITTAATERVRHEAEVLERLWSYPSLRPHIPRVLHAGEWGGGYILFQSSGPAHPGGLKFGPLQAKFMETLWSAHRIEKPGHVLIEEVTLRWRKVEPLLNAEWRGLGQRTLAHASREVGGATIPCGIMHGDFGPSQTRKDMGTLFVFDWEVAAWDAPNLWDVFNFHVVMAEARNKKRGPRLHLDRRSGERGSFLLYLLYSLCGFLGEKLPLDRPDLTYRRQLLFDQLFQKGSTCARGLEETSPLIESLE